MTNHNDIQASCTSGEEEPELIASALYGFRSWTYSANTARLTGHWDTNNPWTLDKPREGTCGAAAPEMTASIADAHRIYPEVLLRTAELLSDSLLNQHPFIDPNTVRVGTYDSAAYTSAALENILYGKTLPDSPVDFPLTDLTTVIRGPGGKFDPDTLERDRSSNGHLHLFATGDLLPHDVTDPRCTCGIYAYHDLASVERPWGNPNVIPIIGLIRGSGFATVGDKGFRVQRAEVVALSGTTTTERLEAIRDLLGGSEKIKVFSTETGLFNYAKDSGFISAA